MRKGAFVALVTAHAPQKGWDFMLADRSIYDDRDYSFTVELQQSDGHFTASRIPNSRKFEIQLALHELQWGSCIACRGSC